MTGNISSIQRFCLNDGPGIRTSIFFNGCNMQCAWCHNPETIDANNSILYYENNCINCLKCIDVCPSGAQKNIDGVHFFDREKCIKCGECLKVCFTEAMAMSGKNMKISEIMFEVLQDTEYYKNSGGGVTLTGGEVLCQLDFAIELSKECKKNNIHTAIETNLNFPFRCFEKLLDFVDLIMLDIKLFDDEKHKKWTGMSNELVFSNLKELSRREKAMIVRTPLIPGVTDSNDNLQKIANYVSQLKGVLHYELLNYNPLGESKYKALSVENKFEKTRPLTAERIEEVLDILKDFELDIKVG